MNKKKYFIAEDGEQKGPFSINELKVMSISKTTLIWKEGFDDWTEAGKIEKLQILLKITPPKLPISTEKQEKDLNVSLSNGKTKSKIELKEKELTQEKLKTSTANNTFYFTKRIFLSILLIIAYFLLVDYFVPAEYSWKNSAELEEYDKRTREPIRIGFAILAFFCFFLVFGRSLNKIFGLFNNYSKK